MLTLRTEDVTLDPGGHAPWLQFYFVLYILSLTFSFLFPMVILDENYSVMNTADKVVLHFKF